MLTLLSLLAVAFVTITRTERLSSAVFVDGVRARMVALAGLESAIAQMRTATMARPWDSPRDPWVYKCVNPAWLPAGITEEVGAGLMIPDAQPSFYQSTVGTHKASGSVGGTHMVNGDMYVLKIMDCASQLYLNGSQPSLAAMLNDLGSAIEEEWTVSGRPGPMDPVKGRGDQILAARDAIGGFSSKRGLFAVAGFTQQEFERLRDYVCVEAWVDPTTVTPTGAMSPENFPIVNSTPRAPVNVNTAPRAVLQSVMARIQSPVAALNFTLAGRIADEIIKYRQSVDPNQGPFTQWHQFYDFVDTLTGAPVGLSPEQVQVLKVHCNPNYTINVMNPEAHVHHVVDKSAFLNPTTEFSFRSMGFYEITSLSRILDAEAVSIAEAQVRTVVKLYEQFIHTTQKDFVDSRQSSFGDSTAVVPNSMTDLAAAQANRTSGHVQLFTRDLKVTSPATLTFREDFSQGFSAAAGDGSPLLRGTDKETGIQPEPGSDLHQDGVYTSNRLWEHIKYSSDVLPAYEGTLEMWVKFDEQDDTLLQPFFWGTTRVDPANPEAGYQCILRGALINGDLHMMATRYFYVTGDPAAYPVPHPNKKMETYVVLEKWGTAGEWHHVALEWSDGVEHRLFVDGARVDLAKDAIVIQVSAAVPETAPYLGEAPYDHCFYVGGQLDDGGALRGKNVTIDDMRIYADPMAYPELGFQPNDRYEHSDPVYVGLYAGAFPTLPAGTRLGTLAWTEWLPKEYNGISIPGLDEGIELGLGKKDKGDDDDDDDDGDAKGGKGGVFGKVPKTKKGKGGAPVSDLGIPTVIVAASEVVYTIEFIIPVDLFPLNFTPILDDIYLMYQGPVKFVSFELSED